MKMRTTRERTSRPACGELTHRCESALRRDIHDEYDLALVLAEVQSLLLRVECRQLEEGRRLSDGRSASRSGVGGHGGGGGGEWGSGESDRTEGATDNTTRGQEKRVTSAWSSRIVEIPPPPRQSMRARHSRRISPLALVALT
jgi:hypothetical protein